MNNGCIIFMPLLSRSKESHFTSSCFCIVLLPQLVIINDIKPITKFISIMSDYVTVATGLIDLLENDASLINHLEQLCTAALVRDFDRCIQLICSQQQKNSSTVEVRHCLPCTVATCERRFIGLDAYLAHMKSYNSLGMVCPFCSVEKLSTASFGRLMDKEHVRSD
jgi:hypothetical protein